MDSPVLSASKRKGPSSPAAGGAASRLVQLQQESRARARNSTSTLFIRDTVARPNMTTLVRCIATALVTCIERGHEQPEPTFVELFDERVHPFSEDEGIDFGVPPDLNTVFLFLAVMFNTEQLSAESGILMLAYIDRIIETSGLTLHASNWRRIVLSTLLLATKVWEDEEVWNADWQSVFPSMTSLDLGRLERKLLTLLQYNVSLKSSVYAKYYFELRSLAESEDQIFPTEPLDRDNALKLEARSQAQEEKIIESLKPTARAKSMMIGKARAPAPMILN